jgi:hypothetical protein
MEHQAKTTEYIGVDRRDPTQKALSGFGGRVESLLGQKKVQASPHMIAALDDFLGGLFALLFGKQGGFQDRTKQPIQVAAVGRRSTQLSKGQINAAGPWMSIETRPSGDDAVLSARPHGSFNERRCVIGY